MDLWRTLIALAGSVDLGTAVLVVSSATAVILAIVQTRRRRRRYAEAARALEE